MAGWYELKTSGDQFHFVLKAGNAESILSSERYTTKAAANNGIASVQKNSPGGSYEKLTAKNGKFYFTLKAANHQVIGSSEMYNSEAARDSGITSVKTNGPTATIKDLT